MELALIASTLWAGVVGGAFVYGFDALLRWSIRGRSVWSESTAAIPGLAGNARLDPMVMRLLLPVLGIVQSSLDAHRPRVVSWLAETDRELTQAGLQTTWDPRVALAYRFLASGVAAVSFAGTAWLLNKVSGMVALLMLGGGVIGVRAVFKGTFHALSQARLAELERRLPYALEFLAMAMRANANIDQALSEYCLSARREEPLATEFRLVLRDQAVGLGSRTAFSNFAVRAPTAAIQLFVSAINHGLEKGLSLSGMLAEQAEAARTSRYQSAERIAKEASIRALAPLMLCVLSCVLALLAPMMANFSLSGF